MTILFGEGAGYEGGDHKDTTMLGGVHSDRSFGSGVNVAVSPSWGNIERVGLIRCAYSGHGIPSADSITSATLRGRLSYKLNTTVDVSVAAHRLLTQWGETYTDEGVSENPATNGQATMDNAKDTNNPITDTGWDAGVGAGFGSGDYVAQAEDSVTFQAGDALGTEYEWDVTDAVKLQFASEEANAGFVLILTQVGGGSNEVWGIGSQEHGTVGYRWEMELNYTIPQSGDCGMHVDMSMGM